MDKNSNKYIILFATLVCVVCSVLLTFFAVSLKDRQEQNKSIDRKKNIIKAFGYVDELEKITDFAGVESFYNERIQEIVIDSDGKIISGKTPDMIDPDKDTGLLPVYVVVEGGKFISLAIPVSGKGLWSTIYGYLALEKDLNTVRGITFYEHGETPGLGGEVEMPWFQNNFVGKKILDDAGRLVSIKVVKGKVDETYSDPNKKRHAVDGISGATMTSKGVTTFLEHDLNKYLKFLNKVRKEGLKINE